VLDRPHTGNQPRRCTERRPGNLFGDFGRCGRAAVGELTVAAVWRLVLLPNATPSVFHQRHLGRVLRSSCNKGLFTGGVRLPLALAELGLIDEYEFVVQPRLAGHGPTLFAGLSEYVDLKLVSRLEFGSGAVAMRHEPRR
jgi:hypothetical protein